MEHIKQYWCVIMFHQLLCAVDGKRIVWHLKKKKKKGSQLSSLYYSLSVTSDWDPGTETKHTQRKKKKKKQKKTCNIYYNLLGVRDKLAFGKYHKGSCRSWCGRINTIIVRLRRQGEERRGEERRGEERRGEEKKKLEKSSQLRNHTWNHKKEKKKSQSER